jgi:hypothetical protein
MRSREGAAAAQAACSAGNRAESVAVDSALGESGGDMLLQPRQCSNNELTEPSGIKKRKLFVRLGTKEKERLQRCES